MDGITFYGRYFNVITMNTQSQKVSMAEKIGYSLGDCSANLVFQMMMIYQTKFYTDIFGLEGAIAGTVMLVARIVPVAQLKIIKTSNPFCCIYY